MKSVFNFFKKHSNVLIPLTGFLCLAFLCLECVMYVYRLSQIMSLDVYSVLNLFIDLIFVYGVGVFMMVYGKLKNRERMQSLIVILSGVYLCVTNFISGTSLVLNLDSLQGAAYTAASVVSFILGLCWVFILYEAGFAYMRGDFNRSVPYIANAGSILVVLHCVYVVLMSIFAASSVWYETLFNICTYLVPLMYVLCLYASYIDVYYGTGGGSDGESHKRWKKEQDKNQQDIDDLDIHSF